MQLPDEKAFLKLYQDFYMEFKQFYTAVTSMRLNQKEVEKLFPELSENDETRSRAEEEKITREKHVDQMRSKIKHFG